MDDGTETEAGLATCGIEAGTTHGSRGRDGSWR